MYSDDTIISQLYNAMLVYLLWVNLLLNSLSNPLGTATSQPGVKSLMQYKSCASFVKPVSCMVSTFTTNSSS